MMWSWHYFRSIHRFYSQYEIGVWVFVHFRKRFHSSVMECMVCSGVCNSNCIWFASPTISHLDLVASEETCTICCNIFSNKTTAGGWAGGFFSICHFDRLFTLTKDRKPSKLRLFWSMNCCQLTGSYCTVCACVQQLIINTFQLSWHHKDWVWSCLESNFFHYCLIWAGYLASLNLTIGSWRSYTVSINALKSGGKILLGLSWFLSLLY